MTVQERLAPGKYRLRVDDYVRLAEAGVFGDARSELIGGEIIVIAPEYRQHSFIRDELTYRLRRALEAINSEYSVGSGSVLLNEHDVPQPDIVLTSEPRGEGPVPVDSVALLIEVSVSTLAQDLDQKARLYAAASVPEYWVVDVNARSIHLHWTPSANTYAERRILPLGGSITSPTMHGLRIDTDDLS